MDTIKVYFSPRTCYDDGDDEEEERGKKVDQAIISYPLRLPNRPYETKRCKTVKHKATAGWLEMVVPTRAVASNANAIDDDDENQETVVLRSEQVCSTEKGHASQKSMLVGKLVRENGEDVMYVTPANVTHQMRPSFTHLQMPLSTSQLHQQQQLLEKMRLEKAENHEEETETVEEETRRLLREQQMKDQESERLTKQRGGSKIVQTMEVKIKANETERQQERRKNSYQFQKSERDKESWSELQPVFQSNEYTKQVVIGILSKKSTDYCGERQVGAREYLDALCPTRGKARRDLPDSDSDLNNDEAYYDGVQKVMRNDSNVNNKKERTKSDFIDIVNSENDDEDDDDVKDKMDVDNNNNNISDDDEEDLEAEINLETDISKDFDDVFVNGFQIRDIAKLKSVDERLDELFKRSGVAFLKFSCIKKLAPRNTKQKELLNAVAARASLINGLWVVNSALRSDGDRNYERVRDSVLSSFSRGKKIPVNDGHNATEERLREKALKELGAATRGPAHQQQLFEFYPARDDQFTRKYDEVVTQQKNRWDQILGFFARGKDFDPFQYIEKGLDVPDIDEAQKKTVQYICETTLKPCFSNATKKLGNLPTVSEIRDVLKRQKSRFYALREPELLSLISQQKLIAIGGHIVSFERALIGNSKVDHSKDTLRTRKAIVRELMLSTSGNIKKEAVLLCCEKITTCDASKILSEMCSSSGGVWSLDLSKC